VRAAQPASQPRITLVAHDVGTPGGMEQQLGRLVRGLLDRGYELTVVAGACALDDHVRLRWVRIPGPRRPFSLWYPWFFLAGSLAAWRVRRGILHTTGALVANRASLSTVHFCHRAYQARARVGRAARSSAAYRLNARLASFMSRVGERYAYRPARTGRLVAVSDGVAHELREFFPALAEAVCVIPNGVDRTRFAPGPHARAVLRSEWGVSEGELIAVFVAGREWGRKGLRYAIEGVANAPGWHLVVVGDGDVKRYGEMAAAMGLGGRVHFVGATEETWSYYACADSFLLPTAYETFSLVTFEAAAAGLPLLVSRVSGVEEILVEGRNGWFIDRDANVISKRLGELNDARLRKAMGAAARADSARFSWDSAIEAYDRLYRELASEGAE
jgi:glycosyltransferase involved in cell wall biosynthesis